MKPVDWMSHARKAPASNPDLNAQLVFWQKHCPKSLLQMKPTLNRFSVMSTILSLVQFYLNRVDYYYFTDNHVQRIWADQTPLRSPGAPSPRPWSPENRRRLPPNSVAIPTKTSGAPIMSSSAYGPGYFQRSSAHHRRKDKVNVYSFLILRWHLTEYFLFSGYRKGFDLLSRLGCDSRSR